MYTMMNQNLKETTSSLVADFQSGDTNAFSKLYDMYINVLLSYGSRLTTDKELLKDCIHDVFVKLYTRQIDLGAVENFKSYLLISLKNKIYDELRRQVYVSETAVEDLNIARSSDDVESLYLVKEKNFNNQMRVQYLLAQLPPRQHEAITLYYMEGWKYEDICISMNMNYQSVRNLIHRGITKLRSLLN